MIGVSTNTPAQGESPSRHIVLTAGPGMTKSAGRRCRTRCISAGREQVDNHSHTTKARRRDAPPPTLTPRTLRPLAQLHATLGA